MGYVAAYLTYAATPATPKAMTKAILSANFKILNVT